MQALNIGLQNPSLTLSLQRVFSFFSFTAPLSYPILQPNQVVFWFSSDCALLLMLLHAMLFLSQSLLTLQGLYQMFSSCCTHSWIPPTKCAFSLFWIPWLHCSSLPFIYFFILSCSTILCICHRQVSPWWQGFCLTQLCVPTRFAECLIGVQ